MTKRHELTIDSAQFRAIAHGAQSFLCDIKMIDIGDRLTFCNEQATAHTGARGNVFYKHAEVCVIITHVLRDPDYPRVAGLTEVSFRREPE